MRGKKESGFKVLIEEMDTELWRFTEIGCVLGGRFIWLMVAGGV